MKIDENELINAIGYASIKKGYDYYKKGMVLGYEVNEDTTDFVELRSSVKGSYKSYYNQDITLQRSSKKLTVSGHCSCPVTFNCKHVFAASLKYINELNSKNPMVKVDKWLDNIIYLSQKNTLFKKNENREFFLAYRIFESKSDYNREDLKFYKTKFKQDGSLAKGVIVRPENLIYNNINESLVDEKDLEILELCKGLYQRWSTDSKELHGRLGYIILKLLADTQRCFYKKESQPLRFLDEKKELEFEWLPNDSENYILSSNLKENFQIIPTKPILVIDKLNSTMQELNSDISSKLLEELLNSPSIPKEHLNEVYQTIETNTPNSKLPTPKEFKVQTIESKPTPYLQLFREENEGNKFHIMRLDFKYDNFKVSRFPKDKKVSFFENGVKTEILRDLKLEEKAIESLINYGFETRETRQGLYFISSAHPSMQAALQRWSDFLLLRMPTLLKNGWEIVQDESFTMKFEKKSDVVVKSDEVNEWFTLSFDLEFNGISRPLVPLISSLIREFDSVESLPKSLNIEVEENHFVQLNTDEILPVLKTIFELFDKKESDGKIKISAYEAHMLEAIDENVKWIGSREVIELSNKLKDFSGIQKVDVPECLKATLRDYQQDGLNWLNFLHEFKFNGILADDMGLGKTLQTLAHLSRLKEQNRLTKPSLIIMPTSLVANWKNEVKKFTPNLSVLSLHGADRFAKFQEIQNYDLILSTYPLITKDIELLQKEEFSYIILDEAQKIKNPKTKMAIAIKTLKSGHRLALSGTPIENHLGELWSIFDFLMPGFLDTLSFFKNYYQTPIEKEHNFERQELLNRRVKPFMLRRTKERVAHELPQKSEIIKYTQFDTKQSKLYESIRVTMEKKVRDAISEKGLGQSHITILDALLKLRQVCCDPSLLKIDEAKKVKDSAKLDLLLDLLDELFAENRKILLFSQFASMIGIIEEKMIQRGISYAKLTGSTTKREDVIEKFTSGNADIFLISLKAGGVGLNLIEADTVIHYDPWWNPAVENQATDRAHRIGQTKAVFVYKLIVENTIEQKIIELQKKKESLQNGIYESDGQNEGKIFDGNELLELLK